MYDRPLWRDHGLTGQILTTGSAHTTGFGAQVAGFRAYIETAWAARQWTRGRPVGVPATGGLYAYGSRLRQSIGRIRWAGTDMDGAVRSGEPAAGEVLAEL